MAGALLARGPEALRSQFTSSYSMVLNLLHARDLDEARAFVQRSFSNYLGMQLICELSANLAVLYQHPHWEYSNFVP